MSDHSPKPLAGLIVVSFESRRAAEMAELVRRYGGTPVVAPSMREIPLEENAEARELVSLLRARQVDVTLLLTGIGTRTLAAAVEKECPREELASLLDTTTIVARGPKPVAALREMGLRPHVTVPEPNTWREILATLDREAPVAGKRVAVQEYGRSNPELLDGLEKRGATVRAVPVYRWALPEDTGPLRDAIRRAAEGTIDIALFTSAHQVDNVAQIAGEEGCREALVDAARRFVIASVGPVCSEALRGHGFPVDLEPEHPKMGPLVQAVASLGPDRLAKKRRETQ